jgi:hypothetical protein
MASGSLVASNFVYLYLSVAFIQMLKAAAPAVVLLVSWSFGLTNLTIGKVTNIFLIVLGVAVASGGALEFSTIGILFQLGGLGFEAVRVVMIQVLLNGKGLKVDPIVGLYYYAPVVAIFNLIIAYLIEYPYFNMADLYRVGLLPFFLNATIAFTVSFSSMVLVSHIVLFLNIELLM